jgi:hypothetical protein
MKARRQNMHYTIAIIEDVQGEIKVNFDSKGNKYQVGIYNTETKEYTHNTFEKQEQAYAIFEKLSKAIVTGCYSYEDRKAMLKQ